MRTPTFLRRPWIAVAATLAATAVLIAVTHLSDANANTGPPDTPANPLAHLIVPESESPRVRVSWDGDPSATGYTVARGDGETFQTAGAATTFSDHTVEPGTAYTYSVKAANAQGTSAASTEASASVPDAPSQPGDLTASVADMTATDTAASVTLTWTASTVMDAAQCETSYPLDGYVVYRSDGTDETELATPGSGDTSFTDDTAAFGTSYTYRVLARNAIGDSPAASTSVNVPIPPVPAPTGLMATITDPFDGAVSLSWDAPEDASTVVGYMIFRYLGADPYAGTDTPTTLDHTSAGTTLTDSNAEAGITYSYIVLARSELNVSDPSNVAVMEAPAPVSDLTAAAGDGAIELAWSAPAAGTAVEYRVARQEQGGDWTALEDTSETIHSDDTAQANVPYRYRVQHRNQYGGSSWTESDAIALVVAPGQPTGLTATVDGNDNVLSWTAPDGSIIDGYRVQHHTGDAEPQPLAEGITDTTYRHADVAADVTHHYAVQILQLRRQRPVVRTGFRNTHHAAAGSAERVPGTRRPRHRRQLGTARHRPHQRLHRPAPGGRRRTRGKRPTAQGTTTYRLTDVAGDVTHYIAVRAHNGAGDSPWSDDQEIIRRLPPSVPTNVTVTVGETDIVLSWGAPATGSPDGYRVEYGEPDDDQPHTANLRADQTSYTHADNVEGVTYQYRVQAHNSAGDSPWSDAMTAQRTLAPPPPTDLAASVSGSAITLSWQAPTTGIVETYDIQYGVADSEATKTDSVAASETTFLHLGATGDTTYSYQVRAVNSAGNSAWTGPVEAMWVIPPTAPTNVAAAINGSDMLVTWTRPNSTFIDEYQLQFKAQDSETWNTVTVAADQTSHRHVGPTPAPRTSTGSRPSTPEDRATGATPQAPSGTPSPRRRRASSFTPFGNHMLMQWNPSVDPRGHGIPDPSAHRRRRMDHHRTGRLNTPGSLVIRPEPPRLPDQKSRGRPARRLVPRPKGPHHDPDRSTLDHRQPRGRPQLPPALGGTRQRRAPPVHHRGKVEGRHQFQAAEQDRRKRHHHSYGHGTGLRVHLPGTGPEPGGHQGTIRRWRNDAHSDASRR